MLLWKWRRTRVRQLFLNDMAGNTAVRELFHFDMGSYTAVRRLCQIDMNPRTAARELFHFEILPCTAVRGLCPRGFAPAPRCDDYSSWFLGAASEDRALQKRLVRQPFW